MMKVALTPKRCYPATGLKSWFKLCCLLTALTTCGSERGHLDSKLSLDQAMTNIVSAPNNCLLGIYKSCTGMRCGCNVSDVPLTDHDPEGMSMTVNPQLWMQELFTCPELLDILTSPSGITIHTTETCSQLWISLAGYLEIFWSTPRLPLACY